MSLLPWLARSPGELVASNIVTSAAEGLGTLLGPSIVGHPARDVGEAGATAAAVAHDGRRRTRRGLDPGCHHQDPGRCSNRTPRIDRRACARSSGSRSCASCSWGSGSRPFVRGMLNVLLVVAAIERLGMGEPGVGSLNAAIGAGGFAGRPDRPQPHRAEPGSAPTFVDSLAMWGLPIAVIGFVTDPLAADRHARHRRHQQRASST